MSKSGELVVHTAVDEIINCHVNAPPSPDHLPMHVMDLTHALLPKIAGSMPACCTLADLMVACYKLGMSRALASVAAGLEGQR